MPTTLDRPRPTLERPFRPPPVVLPPVQERAPRRRGLIVLGLALVIAAGIGVGAWALVDHYTGAHGTTYVAPAGAPAIPAYDQAVVAKYGTPDPWMLAVVTGSSPYVAPLGAPAIGVYDPAVIARYGLPDPWMYAAANGYITPVGAPAIPAFTPSVIADYGPPDPWMLAAVS